MTVSHTQGPKVAELAQKLVWQKEHGLCGCQTKLYSHTELYECIQSQNSRIKALVHTNTHLYKQFTKLYKQKWLPLKVARLNNASFLWYTIMFCLCLINTRAKHSKEWNKSLLITFLARICCSFSVSVTRRTKNSSGSFDRSVCFEDECII